MITEEMRMSFVSYFLQYNRYCNLLGIFVVIALAILASRNRNAINYSSLLRHY